MQSELGMRRLRVRFTLRTMMILVALVGVICLGGREFWRTWLRRGYYYPVYPSQLSATAGDRLELIWRADEPTPVVITYNFMFGTRKPAPGTTCVLLAEVWFEDVETGLAVDGYTFDAPLTVGGREAASGSLTWDAVLPRPGPYFLRCFLHYTGPTGELRRANGNGRRYQVVAAASSSQPRSRSGAKP
jgi:hypothetical protein